MGDPGMHGSNTPACLLTIFGATGDLTKRLLLPSLYNLIAAKVLPDDFRLLGVAVEPWDDAAFRKHITETLPQFWGADADPAIVQWLASRAFYRQANFDQPSSFDTLSQSVAELERQEHSGGNRLFYLAVAPSFIAGIAGQLSRVNLLGEDGGCWRRLVIEKPFGHDLPSAVALMRICKSLCEKIRSTESTTSPAKTRCRIWLYSASPMPSSNHCGIDR